jgi:hypothetical protein
VLSRVCSVRFNNGKGKLAVSRIYALALVLTIVEFQFLLRTHSRSALLDRKFPHKTFDALI